MSMISCKECGKEISSEAPMCPSCGSPQKVVQQKQRSVFTITLKVIVSIFIIGGVSIIIGLYTCWGIYKLGDRQVRKFGEEKRGETLASISIIEKSLDSYKKDHGKYPNTIQGLRALGPYLDNNIPADGWDAEFIYSGPADPSNKLAKYTIISMGEDGVFATDDDISSRDNN